MKRRDFINGGALLPLAFLPESLEDKSLIISAISVHVIKVNARGNWYFVELKTNKGITGLGEASHGFSAAVKDGETKLLTEIRDLFKLVKGESPFGIEQFRQRALHNSAQKGKIAVTAFSAIEHALWDLNGKALGVPVYNLLGGKLKDQLKVYANINRATNERDANGRRLISAFQENAESALKNGFKAVKLAPFDDMKPLANSDDKQISSDIDYAVSCIEAVRKTIGPDIDLLIDVHSHLNKRLAISTAKRLEPSGLFWFEEAIDPEKNVEATKEITDTITQGSAGGESIFGREGFKKIINTRALDIIMPDVKHCGGIQELRFIAAMAEMAENIMVAPHNPSGPVSTAASVQVCASIPNFSILEYAYGEVPWRADLLSPAERFENGHIHVPDTSGLGHTLNYGLLKKYSSFIFTICMVSMATAAAFSFRAKLQIKDKQQQITKPNIIYILADDLGYGDIAYLNEKSQIETPNLDKLGRDGLTFTDAHSGSAVCSPTRYGILTGRYAFRSRLKKGVLGGYSPMLIEPERFTVADLLKKAGYRTGVIGKWHLGLDWARVDPSKKSDAKIYDDWASTENLDIKNGIDKGPNDLGFDYSHIILSSLDIPPYIYLENGQLTDNNLIRMAGNKAPRGVFWRDGNSSESFKMEKTLNVFEQKAKDFLIDASRAPGKPFFLYLPLSSPHTPWLPSEKFRGKSGAGLYGDFVMHTDAVVGKVLKTLDSLGLSENTLVIFTSDNGADWKPGDKHVYPGHQANYIFRGQKSDIWEGGHHIPFLARWPKIIKKGTKTSQTICLTDFFATAAAITNQYLPKGAAQDSFDFYSVLKNPAGKKPVRESIIHHSIEGMFAIRKGKWKFVDGKGSGGWSSKGDVSDPDGQLYDLEIDPTESNNLYAENQVIVKELKKLLNEQKKLGYTRKP